MRAFVLFLAAVALAQENTPVLKVSTQLVVLDVVVADKKTGAPALGLEAEDFVVSEDGKPQTISYFSHDRLPLSIVFLFDLTDTVRPILKPLAGGALEMLGHLKPQDSVASMVFSSHTELLQGFTPDHTLAASAVQKAATLKSRDGTFIHEDMYEAVEQAMKSTLPESRRVLVWLTDGTSNIENALTKKLIGKQAPDRLHSKQEATQKLLETGVVVSALIDRSALTDAFIAASDINPLAFIGGGRIGDVSKYAELTGGPVLKTTKKEVAARLAELIDQLRGRYTLGYRPAQDKQPGTFCKLQVKLTPHSTRPGLSVRTRVGYYR